MKLHNFVIAASTAVVFIAVTPAFAAEGAASGNGTSTPAGPAGDNQGPSKSSGASSTTTSSGGASTGAGENKATATGGQSGGSPSKN